MQTIKTNQITITDPYLKRAQDNLVNYLLSMESKRFLYEVYKVAELPPLTSEGYAGWERSNEINFRGHFFGHYMSALALAYQSEKDGAKQAGLLNEMQDAVNGLATAQDHYALLYPESAGYISAFREVALDEVEGKQIPQTEKENVLVPWYNLHKVLAGLLDIAELMAEVDEELSQKALKVASNFGDYIYQRMQKLADKNRMLQIEYGGMNDGLYHLYELTGKKEHRVAATYFDEDELFAQLAEGHDVLAGKHANTQIPKFIGAIKRYRLLNSPEQSKQLTPEEQATLPMYFEAAKNFWEIVVNHHTYCTGGNSQSEHFHEADALYYDAEIRNGDCTCETCNTHNMLKLTRHLYAVTKDAKYLEYYEQTYINAILASQNPETGMMMYFQPMGAGYNKVYNRPYEDFWCCTGTGVESFAKLADTYYLNADETIFVNLYFSNEVTLPEKGLRLSQVTDRKKMQTKITAKALNGETSQPVRLALRWPDWSEQVGLTLNGEKQAVTNEAGFVYLAKTISAGDVIEFVMQPQLTMLATQDNPDYVALAYGPYVLAGALGAKDVTLDNPNGIIVRVGTKDQVLTDTLTYTNELWQSDFTKMLTETTVADKTIAFETKGLNEKLVFSPYYEMHGERYGIYFKRIEAGSAQAQEMARLKAEVAKEQASILAQLTNFDENNSEYTKQLKYENSFVGAHQGRRYRKAEAGGWFSYEFNTGEASNVVTLLTFNKDDSGQSIKVSFNDFETVLTVNDFGEENFITQEVNVPQDVFTNRSVKVTFASLEETSPRIFGITFKKAE